MATQRHWLIWDGECGFCSHMATSFRRQDTQKLFQICSYQNCPRPPMTDDAYKRAAREILVFTTDGRCLGGANAFLFFKQKTGWGAIAAVLRIPPFIWLLQGGYWLIARNRGLISKLFYGGRECGIDNRYPEVEPIEDP